MAALGGSKHLDLEPRCGACADVIFEHERVVALYGYAGPDAHGYISHTKPFPYPLVHYTEAKVENKQLCTRPGCELYRLPGFQRRIPEAVTVHYACFSIYMHEAVPTLGRDEAERRLFTTGLYRNPWPRAHPLSLTDTYYMSRSALSKTASISGLPQLGAYPAELLEMIRQSSNHSIFWRTISVIALAERLCATSRNSLLVVPIYEIDSWERGGMLERWTPPDDLPTADSELDNLSLEATTSLSPRRAVVRLTIDAEGIQKIELLRDRPPYIRERTASTAYMVEELATLKGVEAYFQDGLVQLYCKSGYPSLRIWDTPAPPSLSQCTIFADKKRPWRHFRTVEFDSITGLTFFYWKGALLGIHPHRVSDPCAGTSFDRLSKRQPAAWIHYPISPSDKILIFGARPVEVGVNILIRSRLSGDVVIGSWGRGTAADTWRRKEPTTLIYGDPPFSCPIAYIGTYCRYLPNKQQLFNSNPDSDSLRPSSSSSSLVVSPSSSLPVTPTETGVGSDPRARHKVDRPFTSFTKHVPRLPIQQGTLLYFSVAPLRDVVSVQIFYAPLVPRTAPNTTHPHNLEVGCLPENSTTEGIILHYSNGGSRALGQVKLHVDNFVEVKNPTHALLEPHGFNKRKRAWIVFVSDPERNEAEPDEGASRGPVRNITYWPMKWGGALRFWFNETEQHIGFRYDD
ncbi:hypothetical protein V8F33_010833 [Rhypophila sp. PSN 637]